MNKKQAKFSYRPLDSKEGTAQINYLFKHIFTGLGNITESEPHKLGWLSEHEFKIVLNRIKEHGLAVFGIEPYTKEEDENDDDWFDCWVFELSKEKDPFSPEWYFGAFEGLKKKAKKMGCKLKWDATYYVPDELLEFVD